MTLRLLLLPLLIALPGAAPAPVTTTLATDAEARWTSFDLTPGNQIRFAMSVGGRPATAVLDTGVSMSVLSRRFAQANGMAVRQEGKADVIGGTVPVGWAATRTLALGALTRTGGGMTVVDLPAAASGGGAPIDLLVGRDLLAGWALDIDYAARRFRLLPSGRLPFRGTSAPLSIAPDRQVYVSSVVLGGALLRPVVIDTGDGAAVTLSRRAWAAAQLPAPATTTISYGVGGAVVNEIAVVPHIVVGQTAAQDVEVRVEPAGGFSDAIGVAGRVGSGFLQNYRVLLDPGAGHMLLAPSPTPRSTEKSTSGLLLGAEPGRLRVLHVMRGSPAATAGWRAGEAICAVDGAAAGRSDLAGQDSTAGWAAGAPGRSVRLTLCDGTERLLALARFY